MTSQELYQTLSSACVVFIYPMGDMSKVWCGVYISPYQIATVLHPFTLSGDVNPRSIQLDLSKVQIIDINGNRLTIKKASVMPTGDAVLIDVAEKGYFIPPHPSPREIKKDSLVYCWSYMISPESPLHGYSPYEEAYRFPYWGLWSLGWWEGTVDVFGRLSDTGDDFWVEMPSVKGQSGSPFITLDPPQVVGLLHATFSVGTGTLLDVGKTYLTSIEHISQAGQVQAAEFVVAQTEGMDKLKYVALGLATGVALVGLATIGR